MRITVKMLEEQVDMLNNELNDLCIGKISVRFEKPTKSNFSTITILNDDKILINEKLNYSDVHKTVSTKTELFTCLGRVMKILSVMEHHNKNMIHCISDYEIAMIFNAAFWR